MSHDKHAAGLAINWHLFGSNGHETADYSKGVLERFTRRAPDDYAPNGYGNAHVKTLANPRAINFIHIPHFANYFEELHAVNENGKIVPASFNVPVTAEKIVINHYYVKSREEYEKKVQRGRSDTTLPMSNRFSEIGYNEIFDDGILRYRDERSKTFTPPDKSRAAERLLNALTVNLSPTLIPNTPPKFFAGKMETFLTCREVAAYLKTKLADATVAKFFEEAALKAILYSFNGMTFADARLFLRELPKLLALPYPVVKEIRAGALYIIPQLLNTYRMHGMLKDFVELDYLNDILKLGG